MRQSNLSRQQQNSNNERVYLDQNGQYLLTISRVSTSSMGFEVKLPSISQPLISNYRRQRLPINLYNNQDADSNFFVNFLCGKSSDDSISMCSKCQRSKQHNLCNFIICMIEQKYKWKTDLKFKSSYQFYHKKRIQIGLTDPQISYRLESKFSMLGVVLLDNHKLLLVRVLRNYLKHTVYYNEQKKLTMENDLYFWFLIGIYYHVGVPKYLNDLQSLPKDSVAPNEYIMFWLLDMIMKKLGDCSEEKIKKISEDTLDYCQHFYRQQFTCLQGIYNINFKQIFYQLINECMMGFMGIQFIGFFIKSILKQGWQYVQKTLMSYFEKITIKLDRDQIIYINQPERNHAGKTSQQVQEDKKIKKQQIMKAFLNSNEEWPGIFFNTSDLEKKTTIKQVKRPQKQFSKHFFINFMPNFQSLI